MRTPDPLRTRRIAFAVLLVVWEVGCGDGNNPPANPPSQPMASQCPAANSTETGPCRPTYVLPSWGDAGGWQDASYYSTIQFADIDVTARRSCSAALRPGSLFLAGQHAVAGGMRAQRVDRRRVLASAAGAAALAESLRDCGFTADGILQCACAAVHAHTGSYQETARRLHLDPRTVRTKVTAWARRQRG